MSAPTMADLLKIAAEMDIKKKELEASEARALASLREQGLHAEVVSFAGRRVWVLDDRVVDELRGKCEEWKVSESPFGPLFGIPVIRLSEWKRGAE